MNVKSTLKNLVKISVWRILILVSIFLFGNNISSAQTQDCDCAYPIIFVHGWAGDGTSWSSVYNELESKYFGTTQVYKCVLNANSGTDIWGGDNCSTPPCPDDLNNSGFYSNDDPQMGSYDPDDHNPCLPDNFFSLPIIVDNFLPSNGQGELAKIFLKILNYFFVS